MKVNVLGTEYEIITGVDEDSDSKLAKMGADGYCDNTTKKIVVAKFEDTDFTQEDLKIYEKDVIRHELIHAFLFESGLDAGAGWAVNEEIVDWMAIQVPKMAGTFNVINKPKNKVYRQKDYPADAVKGDIYYRPVIDESGNDFYIMKVHDGCEFKPV